MWNRQETNNLYIFQESQFDVVIEDLFNATIKLEEKEKVCMAVVATPY